jgi:hypothetical protein
LQSGDNGTMDVRCIHPRTPHEKTMSQDKLEECLTMLRQADEILMEENEIALACHLSLVIELLCERLDLAA